MGLIPDQTARHEITNRVSIHSPLNDAPCGIGEQIVNMSVIGGSSANAYSAAASPEYILMVPFQASAKFTPVSFDFAWLASGGSISVRVILCDDTGKIVAFSTAGSQSLAGSSINSLAPTVAGTTLPAGVYYLGFYFSNSFDASSTYGCFGSFALNKIPNLRAMGCYTVEWSLAIDTAAALGDTLTFVAVQTTTQTNVVQGWVRCLTNV